MSSSQHVYEVRPRKDRRGVDLISDALPFGPACHLNSPNARIADSSSINPVSFFIRAHNETLPVIAVRVRNEDYSPVRIDSCHTAPTPTGFAETVSDYLPVFHASDCASFALHMAMTK